MDGKELTRSIRLQRDYGNLGRDFETSITVENKQLFYLAEITNRTFTAQGSTEDIRWYSM